MAIVYAIWTLYTGGFTEHVQNEIHSETHSTATERAQTLCPTKTYYAAYMDS